MSYYINPQYREQIVRQLTSRGVPVTEENILKVAQGGTQGQAQAMPQMPSAGQQLAQTGINAAGTSLGQQAVKAGIGALAGTGATTAATAGTGAAATGTALAAPTVVSATPVATATTAAAGAPIAAPIAAGLGQAALGIGGAYGLYNTVDKSWKYKQRGSDLAKTTGKGAASGAAIGTAIMPGVGTAVGAGIGALTGFVSGFAGSGKDAHQRTRDDMRDRMVELGLYQHTPATKEQFTMGADGKYRLDDGRRAFEIVKGQAEGRPERDFTPEEAQAIGLLNPLGTLVALGSDKENDKVKGAGNTVGLLYNELDRNVGEAGVNVDEIKSLYDKAGADQGSLFKAFEKMTQAGAITPEEQAGYNNAINQLYGQEYYSDQQTAEDLAASELKANRLLGINGKEKR